MEVTPLLLAQLSNQIYESLDGFDNSWTQNNVVIGHKHIDGVDVIVLRGSLTAEDWMRNAEALPEWHPQLGFCHSGFLLGMDEAFASIRKVVGKSIAITGHSLGGARARILAALFTCNQIPVDMLCVFGAPKPGFVNLARIIQKSGMQHVSFRNRRDIVPILPCVLPLWYHTEDWTPVDAAPEDDNFEPLRDHQCTLYIQALTAK